MEQRKRQLQNASNTAADKHATDSLAKPFLNVLLKAKLDGRELNFREIYEEISTFIFTV